MKRTGAWTSTWTLTAAFACVSGLFYGLRLCGNHAPSCERQSSTTHSACASKRSFSSYSGLYAGGIDPVDAMHCDGFSHKDDLWNDHGSYDNAVHEGAAK